jgi:dephospho-CoA kinase
VLRVGLTGGIGSGKSTVARRWVRCGAVLVDSDVLAREVVAPGTDGLAEIIATFGDGVRAADGGLDRPALAAIVFRDQTARERLNSIVHPRVRRRSDELIAAAATDAVIVQDIPLLVEGRMGPQFPVVVVVHAPATVRIERLVRLRGMAEADARARVAAQADDDARRAAADIWLDNGGAQDELAATVDELWSSRLVPFEENLRLRRVAPPGRPVTVEPDPQWTADGARLAARVAAAAGELGRGVAHVGPTAVPGWPAVDVVEVLLAVADWAAGPEVDRLRAALQDAGFPICPPGETSDDRPRADHFVAAGYLGRHGSADPGRAARLHLCRAGSPEWRSMLLLRDWWRAGTGHKAPVAPGQPATERSSAVTLERAEAWAKSSGWVPTSR